MSAPVFFKLKYNGKYVSYIGGGMACLTDDPPGFDTFSSFYIAPTLSSSVALSAFISPETATRYERLFMSPGFGWHGITEVKNLMQLQAAPGCNNMFHITTGDGQYVQSPLENPAPPPPSAAPVPVPIDCAYTRGDPGPTPDVFEMVPSSPAFRLQYPNGKFLSYDKTTRNFGTKDSTAPAAVFELLNGQVIISGTLDKSMYFDRLLAVTSGTDGSDVTITYGLLPGPSDPRWAMSGNKLYNGQNWLTGPFTTSPGPLTLVNGYPNANLSIVPYDLEDSTQYAVYQLPILAGKAWPFAGGYDFQMCPKKGGSVPIWAWVVIGLGVLLLAAVLIGVLVRKHKLKTKGTNKLITGTKTIPPLKTTAVP
jgi:hypothetical protein